MLIIIRHKASDLVNTLRDRATQLTFHIGLQPIRPRKNSSLVLINSEEKEILEDLIVAAFNDAKEKIQKRISDEMSSITGGIKLPPGIKLPF